MYMIEKRSPFGYCGIKTRNVVEFVETYLLHSFVQLDSDDYLSIEDAVQETGKLSEDKRTAESFFNNFKGKEEIKELLKELLPQGKYGFFERLELSEEEPDEIAKALIDCRRNMY